VVGALVAASVFSTRLGLSAIPAFIVAGVLLGEHPPLGLPSLIEGSEAIELLSELGIVLLLFFLGLEFSLERLRQAGRLLAVGGAIDLAINGLLGFGVGVVLFGVGPEALLMAGLMYVSSSGIISRALFDFRRLADDETDLVLGILVFEDLAIALFLGIAAALATGEAVGAESVLGTGALALGFVVAVLLLSAVAHRVIDRITPRLDAEEIVLGALAIALAGAALGELAGVSEAVGALLAGVLLSSTQARDQIETQLLGIRDFAAGIFFFAFGVTVDLGRLPDVIGWLALAVPVAVFGKLAGGYLAGRVLRFRRRQSVNVAAALVARGEFSIILAQLAVAGVALDLAFREQVGAFAGIFVVVTAALGVVFMKESRTFGRRLFPSRRSQRRRDRGLSNG
jgi:CPA2 family monovalent cation:H+ antiporter-2